MPKIRKFEYGDNIMDDFYRLGLSIQLLTEIVLFEFSQTEISSSTHHKSFTLLN